MDWKILWAAWGQTLGTNTWWYRIGMYETAWLWGFWLIWAFLIGSCMGSFLNVCVLRIPRGESIAGAPSHCFGCGYGIRWYDNVPLISYLALRGRCRKCGMHIPARYFVMELVTGLLFAGAVAKAGWSSQTPQVLGAYAVLLSLSIATLQIDWKVRIIPDVLTCPAMFAGLVLAALMPESFARSTWYGGLLFAGISLAGTGIFLGLFSFIGEKIAKQEVFGLGDVKFMMAAAALAGWTGALFILTAGALGGVVFGLYVGMCRRMRGRRMRGTKIPLGPFLSAAAGLWIFAGDWILRWYLVLLTH